MKTLLRSFAGGEITPELYGRLDLAKFQTGLAKALNFEILPHGPAARRPGLEYIGEVNDSTTSARLIPFEFSATQSVAIEFGASKIRFWIEGDALLESSKAVVSIVGSTVTVTGHGWTTGDDVYIGTRFHRVTVTGANTFTTADRWGVATTASGATAARVYGIASPYAASDLFSLHFAQDSDVLTITHPGYPAKELRRLGAASWELVTVDFTPATTIPTGVTVTTTIATAGGESPQSYCVTAVAADGVTESLKSDVVKVSNNLTTAGNFNTVEWDAVDGAYRYNIYKQKGGAFGYIGQVLATTGGTTAAISSIVRGDSPSVWGTNVSVVTAAAHPWVTGDKVFIEDTGIPVLNGVWAVTVVDATHFTYVVGSAGYDISTTGTSSIPALALIDDNVLPDTSKTPPEDVITLNTSSAEYPTAVNYYEQRRWFGGTSADPQTVWATRNGTQSNLTSSVPSQADDGMEFRIASRQQNAILHLLPLADLIALTVGGEFRIFADSAPAITPTSLSVKPQGYSGASNVQPALTSGSILYVQAQGSRMRELAYDWQKASYSSIDISIMAPHLFNGYTVVDLAYARAPTPTLWVVRNDGVLLGMTYVPEQQVYAWHQHNTVGTVESVCVVSESNEDALYLIVKRTINGRSVRYVERRHSRIFVDLEDAFYVDSGLTYSGASTSTVTGLYHLEGKTVQVLVDGAIQTERTVTGGSITLDAAGSTVHVGLGYTSDLQTLPVAFEGAPASGQGTTKNVNGIAVRVTQSSMVSAGPTFDDLTAYPARDVSTSYDVPPSMRTAELRFDIAPDWNSDGAVCLRQDQPLPLTVLSMTLDVAPGG